MKIYANCLKRVLDFVIALCAFTVSLIILIPVSIILYFANKGAGVFFLQPRPGKNGKIFKVIKFKTMTDEKDAEGKLLPDFIGFLRSDFTGFERLTDLVSDHIIFL